MLCFRVVLVIMLMVFTACATCAILFPQFTLDGASVGAPGVRSGIYFWYTEAVSGPSTGTTTQRQYTRSIACDSARLYYILQSALSVAGAALGGLATLFMACWVFAGQRRCLGGLSLTLTLLAFACCGATLALSLYTYMKEQCSAQSAKELGYSVAEGFGLICAAAGGFLFVLFLEMIECCCCTGEPAEKARDPY